MTIQTITILKGKVEDNPDGKWDINYSNIYVGDTHLADFMFNNFRSNNIKMTIEIIKEDIKEDKNV